MRKVISIGLVTVSAVGIAACGERAESPTNLATYMAQGGPSEPTTTPLETTTTPTPAVILVESQTVPTLRILYPRDGDSMALPAEIEYEVVGFDLAASGGHLHAYLEGIADEHIVEIPLQAQSGVAVFPDDKLVTGRRSLTFELVRSDHTPLGNPEARVTVRDVVIIGRR